MNPSIHQHLTAESLQQNVLIFQGEGLSILAALWEYAFCPKVNRIFTDREQTRLYDLDDAVVYLREYIRAHGNRAVSVRMIEGWARSFNLTTSARYLLETLNVAYRRRYRANGIITQ